MLQQPQKYKNVQYFKHRTNFNSNNNNSVRQIIHLLLCNILQLVGWS